VADIPRLVSVLVTVISTEPAAWAGATAVIDIGEVTLTSVAGVPPNATTSERPPNPVPEMVTSVPPAGDPISGLTAATVGGGLPAMAGATDTTEFRAKSSKPTASTASTQSRCGVITRLSVPLRNTPRCLLHRCPMLHMNCSPLEQRPPHRAIHRTCLPHLMERPGCQARRVMVQTKGGILTWGRNVYCSMTSGWSSGDPC
jgi:hypothetical protein